MGFLCLFEKIPCKAFFSGKNGVWNGSQTMWDSFQTSAIITKNLPFYVSETLAAYVEVCLRTHALAYVCRLLPMYMGQGPL